MAIFAYEVSLEFSGKNRIRGIVVCIQPKREQNRSSFSDNEPIEERKLSYNREIWNGI